MAKKKEAEAAVQPNPKKLEEKKMSDVNLDMNFNLEEEVLAEPLIPNGTYMANVTAVSYDSEKMSIVWQLCLADNGGEKNDGETPIDGSVLFYRNWLPRPTDDDAKSNTKKRMLKKFAEKMEIDMNTPLAIMEGLNEAKWIGLECRVVVKVSEWQGEFRNEVDRMEAA